MTNSKLTHNYAKIFPFRLSVLGCGRLFNKEVKCSGNRMTRPTVVFYVNIYYCMAGSAFDFTNRNLKRTVSCRQNNQLISG